MIYLRHTINSFGNKAASVLQLVCRKTFDDTSVLSSLFENSLYKWEQNPLCQYQTTNLKAIWGKVRQVSRIRCCSYAISSLHDDLLSRITLTVFREA